MLASVSYSQTSENSIPTDRAALVSLCEQARDEVIASRSLVKAYEVSVKEYDTRIANAEKLQMLSDDEVTLLKKQRDQIKDALDKERKALSEKTAEVTELRKTLAKVVKSRNFYKNLTKILTVTTVTFAAVAASVILKE
jgi:hypothetical protein